MRRTHPPSPRRLLTVTLAGALALGAGACSDDDEDGTDTADTGTEETATETTASETAATEGTDGGGDGDIASGCGDLLTVEEVSGLFGEEAELVEGESSTNEGLGQTLCVWDTIDTAADDTASQSLILQHYDGSTIPGTDFYDPDQFYPEYDALDLGDEGFISVTTNGVDIGFVAGETATFMAWFALDMSGGEAPTGDANRDTMVELATLVESRTS